MYVIVTHIPIYVSGTQYYVDISWQRDLKLAQDWLASPFGGLKLVAPSLPLEVADSSVMSLAKIGHDDGTLVIPSFDFRCRTREFWIHQRRQWIADVRRSLDRATVIHSSASDIYRPLAFLANSVAASEHVAKVFVGPDSDPHVMAPNTFKGNLYRHLFDLFMQNALGKADLALLKEGIIYDRYRRYSANAKAFCHSMHSRRDVVSETALEKRLATLPPDRPLRAVYAGRFIPGKGLHDAIAAIGIAKAQGVDVEYHLFGSGPEEDSLKRLAKELDIEHLIKFHGFVEYGPQFIARLSNFDLLLFLPTQEDTARMVYDAMAAGLPLLGTSTPFLTHRVRNDRMGLLVNIGDKIATANLLRRLYSDPNGLKDLSRSARQGGHHHACEEWYRLRSEWTQEAVEKYRAARKKH